MSDAGAATITFTLHLVPRRIGPFAGWPALVTDSDTVWVWER